MLVTQFSFFLSRLLSKRVRVSEFVVIMYVITTISAEYGTVTTIQSTKRYDMM